MAGKRQLLNIDADGVSQKGGMGCERGRVGEASSLVMEVANFICQLPNMETA